MKYKIVKKILLFVFIVFLFIIYSLLYFKSIAKSFQTNYIIPIKHENITFIDYVYIPAIFNEIGVLTRFYLTVFPGSGYVFISLPPFFEREYQTGFLFSKEAVCKLYENCNNYTYLFYTDDVKFAEGFSGTAGFSLLILSFFKNKTRIVNYPITGFMLPNGVIAPVSGIDKKLEATLKEFRYLVAPAENEKILSAYTILDLLKIYFNESYNYEIAIPEEYNKIIKEVAIDICENITRWDVKYALENGRYYTAASLCYREKSANFDVNLSEKEIDKLIEELEKLVKNYVCNTYACEEIKYQVLNRLYMAKNLSSKEKYWRYYTAKGWFKFIEIANNINRKDTCNRILEEVKVVSFLYPDINYKNLTCFEIRELLAKIYSSYVTYRNKKALESIINLTKYFMMKNGFSISAYNYLQYAEDLYDIGDKDSAFYYAILSLEYAI